MKSQSSWWTTNLRILGWGCLLAAGLARAQTNLTTVTLQAQLHTNQFETYAQVEPVTVISIQPVEAGVVTSLDVLPGAGVGAGQKLAELVGPEIKASQAQAEAAAAGAEAKLAAAKKRLQVAHEQLASHLSTQQQIADAESAVANASGALDVARAGLNTIRLTTALIAPSDGTVLSVNVGNGQRVASGQTILTLQPTNGLWLKATYYGSDIAALHPGMTGEFSPVGGSKPIPVKIVTVFGALEPGGGEAVGLLPTVPEPGWLNGQFGTVEIRGEVRSLVNVPTRALILDKGQWWVLVRTSQGDRPRQVVPGSARGWQTFIENGLEPGAQVVVENAYLEFHREISKNYQPPD